MRDLVENHQRDAVYFTSKGTSVNLQQIRAIMKVIMIQNPLVAVGEDFRQGKSTSIQKVKRRKGEELQGRNNLRYQTLKDITRELKLVSRTVFPQINLELF